MPFCPFLQQYLVRIIYYLCLVCRRMKISDAKQSLDTLIAKQRTLFYKPIQIAEILYHIRQGKISIHDLENLEVYRNPSKKWRDEITRRLVGHVSTSSAKFQDDLFTNKNISPEVLKVLALENKKYPSIVEQYIYTRFSNRHDKIMYLLKKLKCTNFEKFYINDFIMDFENTKNIRRSIDKVYEIIVYALFYTLVQQLNVKITIDVSTTNIEIIKEFEDFTKAVMDITSNNLQSAFDAKIFRAGVTNASDRGLDMWANFGPVIQVKHLTLKEELADDISSNITADRIIIVCKDAESHMIEKVLTQLGQQNSIITQNQLIKWYELALRGKFSKRLGKKIINHLITEFQNEFPYTGEMPSFYNERYKNMQSINNDSIFRV